MDIKELLSGIPDILKYGIPGLSVILLFFSFLLLKKESTKENPSKSIIKSIKFYLYISAALIILFLAFELLNKTIIGGKWTIHGDIQLKNDKNEILHRISKDKCGDPLQTALSPYEFLESNLKITLLPNLPYTSFASKSFTADIPINIRQDLTKVFFELNGFHCISDNCQIALNTSHYNPEIKLVFVQDTIDREECSSIRKNNLANE